MLACGVFSVREGVGLAEACRAAIVWAKEKSGARFNEEDITERMVERALRNLRSRHEELVELVRQFACVFDWSKEPIKDTPLEILIKLKSQAVFKLA